MRVTGRLVIGLILCVTLFCSCTKESVSSNVIQKEIVTSLPGYSFHIDDVPGFQMLLPFIHQAVVVNSEKVLIEYLKWMDEPLPEELRDLDFERYSFIMSYLITICPDVEIVHTLTEIIDEEGGASQYKYYIHESYKECEDMQNSSGDAYVYLTGIIIDKVDSNAVFDLWIVTSGK